MMKQGVAMGAPSSFACNISSLMIPTGVKAQEKFPNSRRTSLNGMKKQMAGKKQDKDMKRKLEELQQRFLADQQALMNSAEAESSGGSEDADESEDKGSDEEEVEDPVASSDSESNVLLDLIMVSQPTPM